jgi:hypothetical protein
MPFYTKTDRFTKTGSGQTRGKLKKECVFFQFIGEYSGEIVLSKDLESNASSRDSAYVFDLGDGFVVDAAPKGNKTRRMNHSSDSVRKTPFLGSHFYITPILNDHFTKTGSGQTWERLRQRGDFCRRMCGPGLSIIEGCGRSACTQRGGSKRRRSSCSTTLAARRPRAPRCSADQSVGRVAMTGWRAEMSANWVWLGVLPPRFAPCRAVWLLLLPAHRYSSCGPWECCCGTAAEGLCGVA